MTRAYLVLTFLSLLFSGCTPAKDQLAGVLKPVVTVNSNSAEVGNFLQITVTGGFRLTEYTTVEEDTIPGAVFGLCFIPSENLVDYYDGTCDTLSLPDGFIVADDEPLYEAQTITVRRGETVKVNHDIRLTATEARGVTIVGYFGVLEDDGSVTPVGTGRVTGGRVFVEFQ